MLRRLFGAGALAPFAGAEDEGGVIRRKLLLLFLAAIVPLLALSGALVYHSLSQQHAAMRGEAIQRADDAIQEVDRELFAHVELLRLLAQSPLLDWPAHNLAAFHQLAVRFKAQLPFWERIVLSNEEDRQILNTGTPYGASLPPLLDLAGHRKVMETGQPVIGNIVGPGPLGSERTPRGSVRVPVVRDGVVRFVLTAVIRTDGVSALLHAERLPPAWRPLLIDGSDRIVAAPRNPNAVGQRAGELAIKARLEGSSGVYRGQTAAGEPLVTAFQKSERTGWSAHVAIPLDLYNAPLERSALVLGAASAIAVALTLLFGLLVRNELRSARHAVVVRERSARLEALGRMTGGVAHDFNNVLTVILSGIDLIERRAPMSGMEKYLTSMRAAAEKGALHVRELMMFSRGGVTRSNLIDLNEHLSSLTHMIQQALREDIVVRLNLLPDRLLVKLDTTQLDLALLNVAANALDAMPDGGYLTITTRRATFPDRSGRQGVAIAITDTGSGIQADVLPHVFEPFFTTKAVGKGTGLGLSQLYGFARTSGGIADIASRPGYGTTVTMYLPLHDPAAVALQPPAPPARAGSEFVVPAGLRRTLVVDDNEAVRTMTADHLSALGFVVRRAANADEALALMQQEVPDLLISDIVMPGSMDGVALAQESRRRWPLMRIVLISGYRGSAAAIPEVDFPVLAKPFAFAELLHAAQLERPPADAVV